MKPILEQCVLSSIGLSEGFTYIPLIYNSLSKKQQCMKKMDKMEKGRISDIDMGAKQSRLSEEDFLFLEEETAMSKTTLEVNMMIYENNI